jgi:hypothetical protein
MGDRAYVRWAMVACVLSESVLVAMVVKDGRDRALVARGSGRVGRSGCEFARNCSVRSTMVLVY